VTGAFGRQFEEAAKAAGALKVDPIPLRGDERPPPPYPVDNLGPRMAQAVRAIVKRVQLPDAIAAHSVLAAVAVAAQGQVQVEMPTKQRRPCSLFLATIAESGDRKTSSDQFAMTPISAYEADLWRQHEGERQAFASVYAVWKANKDEIAKKHKDKDPAFIKDEVKRLGEPPAEPPLPTIVVPPGSTQGVVWALEKGRPSVGLFLNEGGAWLGSWGMSDENRTATISAYSELWDGQPIKTLTKGEGYRFLPNRAFSFHVMFQPTYIQSVFADEEMRGQGFVNRILATQPETLAGTRLKDVNEEEPAWVSENLDDFGDRLSSLIRYPLAIDEAQPASGLAARRVVTFSPDAAALFWQFYNHIEVQQGKGGTLEAIRGFAGKAVEQASRLATVIHVFERGMRNLVLSGEDMARAIRLMDFYIEEALRLADARPDDPRLRDAQALSDWLASGWPHAEIGFRQIQRKAPRRIRNKGVDDLRDLCGLLERHDHITPIAAGADVDGERCKVAWRIHVGR